MGPGGPGRKLDALLEENRSEPLLMDGDSRLVFMSDCHRGNGGRGDDFAHNRIIFMHALAFYRSRGFTYVEVGDGEELWENSDFSQIWWAYSDVYVRLGFLHSEGRFIQIWGNHNNLWRSQERIDLELMPALWSYFDGRPSPILEDMDPELLRRVIRGEAPPPDDRPVLRRLRSREALVLRHRETDLEVLVAHGQQGELFGDRLWPLSRFLVRHVWRMLQNAGLRPRITPAGNYALKQQVESKLTAWCRKTGTPLIAGHTHQPEFPAPSDPPYFNCGSCVHPRCITAIEIQEDSIRLVKWHLSTPLAEDRGQSSDTRIMRTVLQGPTPLESYVEWPAGARSRGAGRRRRRRAARTAGRPVGSTDAEGRSVRASGTPSLSPREAPCPRTPSRSAP